MKLNLLILCFILKSISCEQSEESRIVGGSKAPDGIAPYICSLSHKDGSQFCGGSIISSKWVLTAGHCLIR